MSTYSICSTTGEDYGIYEAETAEDAFAAMVADGGGEVGSPEVGTADDWIITEVEQAIG